MPLAGHKLPAVPKPIADLSFQRWILDDTNLGDHDTIVSRIHLLLIGEEGDVPCHADLVQRVGSDYAEGDIRVLLPRRCARKTRRIGPQGPIAARRPECVGDGPEYDGPLNVPRFNASIVAWFRERVAELRTLGRLDPAPHRMPDMEFFGHAEDRFGVD